MIRSPSSAILHWGRARPFSDTPTGGSSPCASTKRAGGGGAVRRWFWLALALAATASPCLAQQAERARALQTMHQEALRIQAQFQERVRAGRLDEAYTLSKRSEALERELIAGVEKAFPDNKALAATFREILVSILAWQADHDEDRGKFPTAISERREVLEIARSLRGEGHWEVA